MNLRVNQLPMLRALRSRNYRLFFAGQGISLIGSWMTQTATIWLVYSMTHSAWLLGVVGFASQFPSFLLTPVSGVLIDKWDRHRTILIAQVLAMSQSFALAFLAMTNTIHISHIIFLSLFQGCINAFDMPARQAFVVKMVDHKDDLSNAIALNSSLFSSARLLGPAVAGFAIAAFGTSACFLIDGVSYIAVIIGLLSMQLPREAVVTLPGRGNLWQELRTGFDYAFGFQPIRAILALTALTSLFGMPYITLMPIFASEVLHGGPETLGFLMAGSGLGALISAVYLTSRPNARGLTKVIGSATAFFGIALIIFASSQVLWLSFLSTLMLGVTLILQRISGNTILQTIIDEDKRGRVMSFYIMSFTGMATFGNLLAGFLASRIGAPQTLAISGFACVLGALLFIYQLPTLRQNIRPIYQRIGLLPQAEVRG